MKNLSQAQENASPEEGAGKAKSGEPWKVCGNDKLKPIPAVSNALDKAGGFQSKPTGEANSLHGDELLQRMIRWMVEWTPLLAIYAVILLNDAGCVSLETVRDMIKFVDGWKPPEQEKLIAVPARAGISTDTSIEKVPTIVKVEEPRSAGRPRSSVKVPVQTRQPWIEIAEAGRQS